MPDTPHLTPAEAADLWARDLDGERFREIARHIARGCPECCEVAAHLPWPSPIAAMPAANDEERERRLDRMYDFRLRGSFKRAIATGYDLVEARDQAKAEVDGWIDPSDLQSEPSSLLVFCRAQAWLMAARAERRDDPNRCLLASVLAVTLADSLVPAEHPEGEVSKLLTETWIELANARRLVGDFEGAEAALHRAAVLADEITPLLEAAEAAAQYFISSRHLAEAEDLLANLQAIRDRRREHHAAGRICLERGIVAQIRQDFGTALDRFLQSFGLLDLENHPGLALAAFHNTIDVSARLGHFETALAWLDRCAPIYEMYGNEIDLIRRQWVEARIYAGLGNLPKADAEMRTAREGFEDRGLIYQASLVTLDLCQVWIRRGKFREVALGVDDAVSTFQALKVRREALAGLLLLQEAARVEQATVAMVQAAESVLRAEGR